MREVAFNAQLAPLSILAFLGTGALTVGGVTLALFLRWRGARRAARFFAAAAGGVLVAYALALSADSLTSHEKLLGRGGEKVFCEIDCHLAYSVEGVTRTRSLGSAEHPVVPKGEFYVVGLRVRFDPTTISSRRPRDVALTPNPRSVYVVDASGRRTSLADVPMNDQVPAELASPILPGESRMITLVFDLPEGSVDPRLFVGESAPETRFIIGHEMSLGHKRAYFMLS